MYLENRIVILRKPGDLVIEEKLFEPVIRNDEVLVEVDRISLCGSDYKLFFGHYNAPSVYPIVIGHEWAGKVLDVGNEVFHLKPGDKVTGDCSIYCGLCDNCKSDKNLCSDVKKYGITCDGFGQRYKVVPARYLYKVYDNMPLKHAALIECFSVASHAVQQIFRHQAPSKQDNALIIGCGAIGMAIHEILYRKFNFSNIQVKEVSTQQIEFIQKYFPETEISLGLNGHDETEFNYIFEANGSLSSFDYALNALKPKGTIVCLGFMPKGELLNLSKIVTKSERIIG
ncbi:MAG: alcohol dehydrogenase catalytic domain-containing protein, partial [Chloroflexia bacterium]|nr:alcohol dehydrogenase catalytic domain-containing protein [Chloroflexia bacterium]